jgi:hypothetical protein
MNAMAQSAVSPPATDRPMTVLVETPPLLLLAGFEGGSLDGVGVGVYVTITSTSVVATWPSSCVVSIWVLLADVRTTGGTEGEELADVADVVELLVVEEGGAEVDEEGEGLELDDGGGAADD